MPNQAEQYLYYKRGEANLITNVGTYSAECEVLQRKNGTVSVRAVIPLINLGKNIQKAEIFFLDGIRVQLGKIWVVNSEIRFSTNHKTVWHFHTSSVAITYSNKHASSRSYALTNFIMRSSPDWAFFVEGVETTLLGVNEYSELTNKIKSGEEIYLPTAKLIFSNDLPNSSNLAESVCQLLSIAQGSYVEWSHYEDRDLDGELVSSYHEERILCAYTPNPLFVDKEIFSFLLNALPGLYEFKKLWDARRLIRLYISGGDQSNYLETRGMLLATTVEALKEELDELVPHGQEKRLAAIYKAAKTIIKQSNLSPEDIMIINQNLSGIKRLSFSEHIRRLADYAKIQISPSDVKNFVECRNVLLHTSKYRSMKQGIETYAQEYLKLLGFVDRVFLRLIGYRGPYRDRTSREILVMAKAEPDSF